MDIHLLVCRNAYTKLVSRKALTGQVNIIIDFARAKSKALDKIYGFVQTKYKIV